MAVFTFSVGAEYHRRAVKEQVGAGKATNRGGPWDTGLVSFLGAHFIFCNIGVAGKTGHNYGNFWAGDDLDWSGSTTSHKGQLSIKSITQSDAEVHVFYRNDSNDPFAYAGRATAVDVSDDSPVRVLWRVAPPSAMGESEQGTSHKEGARKEKRVTFIERNPKARRECLKHYGPQCDVCGLNFINRYGELGAGFMHVHHLTMLSSLAEEADVDPINDLRPVCPNCHSMLHRTKPPLTIEALKARLK
ncbi:MAG: HNH endonuclease [Pseudomonadota bacterium]